MKRPGVVSLLMALSLAACVSTPRQAAPPTMFGSAAPVGFPANIRYVSADWRYFSAHRDETTARLRAAIGDDPFNILALSGGGAGGAFGAGALIGLGHAGKRPRFALVTGVSAGALLAPFAFLGPSWDGELTATFGAGSAGHLLHSRGIGILFHPGLFKSKPLEDLVGRFVTDDMLEAIAREYKQGRMLLVATTDLDKEETVIWDMGAIAAHGGSSARALFRQVLVASASIPGVFPPVLIHVEDAGRRYDEMHVDGGTTVPFFLASELVHIVPLEFDRLKGANLYVIVNGRLIAPPETTRVTTTSVLRHSIAASRKSLSRTTLELSDALAQRYQMQFQFAHIPSDFPYDGALKLQGSAMQALFQFGAHCAEGGQLWTSGQQAVAHNESMLTSVPLEQVQCPGERSPNN